METKIINISHNLDAATAYHRARELAVIIGFDQKTSEEIAIVVSELATNQLKYASGGVIDIQFLQDEQPGLRIEAVDQGPGIRDIEQAMADGFSTSGSLGYGLGTINRLMDVMEIHSNPGNGVQIICKRWLPSKSQALSICPIDIGVATRPHPMMTLNGDSFVVKRWDRNALVGIIDGLGHGQFANLASTTAREYVETHNEQELESIFQGTNRACLHTRGVVMALARFDSTDPDPAVDFNLKNIVRSEQSQVAIKLTIAYLGNIEMRFFGSYIPKNIILRRGVVGLNAPKPVVSEYVWGNDSILVLHSDGLSTHWRLEDFPNLTNGTAGTAAQDLLHSLAKEEDDATVVVVKGLSSGGAL